MFTITTHTGQDVHSVLNQCDTEVTGISRESANIDIPVSYAVYSSREFTVQLSSCIYSQNSQNAYYW